MNEKDEWDEFKAGGVVVIDRVDAVAVYLNPAGEIVIRQQDRSGNGDAIVIIPRRLVNDLVEALMKAAAEDDDA